MVITGDMVYPMFMFSGTSNNLKATKKVSAVMEELGVPWTCVFGNHDEEPIAFYKKDRLADWYESCPNCLFAKGEPELTGVGNHYMVLESAGGEPVMLLMMIDSNSYEGKGFFSGFDVIHDDQLDWYERVVKRESPEGKTLPSLAFFHIPPAEFKEGWEKCYRGDPAATYHLGFVGEKDNYFGRGEDGTPRELQGLLCGARPPQHAQHHLPRHEDDLRHERRLPRVCELAGADPDSQMPHAARRDGDRHKRGRDFRGVSAPAHGCRSGGKCRQKLSENPALRAKYFGGNHEDRFY